MISSHLWRFLITRFLPVAVAFATARCSKSAYDVCADEDLSNSERIDACLDFYRERCENPLTVIAGLPGCGVARQTNNLAENTSRATLVESQDATELVTYGILYLCRINCQWDTVLTDGALRTCGAEILTQNYYGDIIMASATGRNVDFPECSVNSGYRRLRP